MGPSRALGRLLYRPQWRQCLSSPARRCILIAPFNTTAPSKPRVRGTRQEYDPSDLVHDILEDIYQGKLGWTGDEIYFLAHYMAYGYPTQEISLLKMRKPLAEVENYETLVNIIADAQDALLPSDEGCYLSAPLVKPTVPDHEINAVVRQRLALVLHRLAQSSPHPDWAEVLQSLAPEEWVSFIMAGLPRRVRHVLALPQPPTIADLKSLPWEVGGSRNTGVYLWIIRKDLRQSEYLASHGNRLLSLNFDVIVGSAFSPRGLPYRALGHRLGYQTRGVELMRRIGMQRVGYFATLFRRPPIPEYDSSIKYLCYVAEAVLMVYLGATQRRVGRNEPVVHPISYASPWPPGAFRYKGSSGANPLWYREQPENSLGKGMSWPSWPDGSDWDWWREMNDGVPPDWRSGRKVPADSDSDKRSTQRASESSTGVH